MIQAWWNLILLGVLYDFIVAAEDTDHKHVSMMDKAQAILHQQGGKMDIYDYHSNQQL